MTRREPAGTKTAFVTGASRGIGRAIAERLLARGDRVAGTARSAESLAEVAARGGENFLALPADVRDDAAVREAVRKAAEWGGGLHIVVANAGVNRDDLVMKMKDEDWNDVIETNLSGVFRTIRAAARPLLKARWGRIVVISSVVGLAGNAGQANYAASKAGVVGLVKSVAKELAPRGITANVVCPGFIETDMTSGFGEDARREILKRIPLGRFGRAEEIAALVDYLTGEEAGFMTGQVLVCDGGMVI